MTNITKQDACDIVNSVIRDQINAGIGWASDNYPPGSLPSWFGGPRSGLAHSLNVNADTFAGAIDNDSLNDTIRYFIGFFAGIRLVRILTYMQGNGYYSVSNNGGWNTYTPLQTTNGNYTAAWTGVVHDGDGITFTNSANVPFVAGVANVLPPEIPQAVSVSKAAISDFCQRLVSRFKALAWTPSGVVGCHSNAGARASLVLSNTICHTSCHSNCHNNRNRR